MTAKKVTTSEFKELIQDESSLIVVDAYADWCGPCKYSSPKFEKLAQKYEGKAKFIKINVDEEVGLANSFQIRSIPSFFILRGNKILASTIGADVKKVESKLKKLLNEENQKVEIVTGYQ